MAWAFHSVCDSHCSRAQRSCALWREPLTTHLQIQTCSFFGNAAVTLIREPRDHRASSKCFVLRRTAKRCRFDCRRPANTSTPPIAATKLRPVVSSGFPHTASSGPPRVASCSTSPRNRASYSAAADCKSIKAKSMRFRTDCRFASSAVVHTIVVQFSSCAARTHNCARRAEADTTRHVCNATGVRRLTGARISGDTSTAGELLCSSLI